MTDTLNNEFINELQQSKVAVVGIGMSGMSTLRFLLSKGVAPKIFDSRLTPPVAEKDQQFLNEVEHKFGEFELDEFNGFDYVIVSPGISLKEPALANAQRCNENIFCDVELFARINTKPVIAVTGSNGKSTVVAWLEDFLGRMGKNAVACGNFGVPVLDVIEFGYNGDPVDVYIIELSSFQLESTHSLICEAATVLNVTPDHMDRYESFSEYSRAKLRIYHHSKLCLYNNDDFETKPLLNCNKVHAFGTEAQSRAESYWYFNKETEELCLNNQVIGTLGQLSLSGSHNGLNAIVVLALANAIGVDPVEQFHNLSHFSGLPHRCKFIADANGVLFVDDSKATNIASTQAALNGLSKASAKNIVLIAGGDAKGADLSELHPDINKHVKKVIAFGKDKSKFADFLKSGQLVLVNNMSEAVNESMKLVEQGDIVLLSPACASIDMYKNYQHRGIDFKENVLDAISELSK
jgi:UDP-N-acetylmuramoylalanine--D-glutamate ligase